jgi:putative copper resistance protein D
MLLALVLCRLVHFASTMMLVGAGVFVWKLAPAELARLLLPQVRLLVAIAISISGISAIAWLAMEAAELGDGWLDAFNWDVISGILGDTEFGRVWRWRLGLAAALLIALVLDRHDRWTFVVPVSALLLASLGLIGHSNLHAGASGWLHKANHCLHLLAAGLWLGGIAPLIFGLMRSGDPAIRSEIGVSLRRFSDYGQLVVGFVLLTGIVNTALTLRTAPLPLASPYQSLLDAKIFIVAAMVAIAIYNRHRLAPTIHSDSGAALKMLIVNSICELVLGICVLAVVSVLGIMAPV